jgi:hypothetical protein
MDRPGFAIGVRHAACERAGKPRPYGAAPVRAGLRRPQNAATWMRTLQPSAQADSIWTATAGHAIAPTCLYRRLQSDRLCPWRKAIMKFVASVLVVFAVVGAAGAIHPPMGPTPGSPSPGGTTTTVSITSTTPSVVPTPEPSTVALALIGFVGGGTYRLLRRRCRPTTAPAPLIPSC